MLLFQILPQGLQGPLVTFASLRVRIGLVLFVEFIHAVVGQMHEPIAEGLHIRRVLHRGESGQAVLAQVNPERIHRGHQHVQPQVELIAVDQVWILHVLLHDNRNVFWYLLVSVYDFDTVAPVRRRGLHYPNVVVFRLLPLDAEDLLVRGQDVRQRHDVELAVAVLGLHILDVPPQKVLAADLVRAREVVELLVVVQILVLAALDLVGPSAAPAGALVLDEEAGVLDDLAYDQRRYATVLPTHESANASGQGFGAVTRELYVRGYVGEETAPYSGVRGFHIAAR